MLKRLNEIDQAVISLVQIEFTNEQISSALNTSVGMVKKRLANIMRYYGVQTKAGIIREFTRIWTKELDTINNEKIEAC